MSMSEPFVPKLSEHNDAPAAADPGPGASGNAATEEPDILPDAPNQPEQDGVSEATQNPPFRTPEPGDRLTAAELKERD